jgi:hypothetical protein
VGNQTLVDLQNYTGASGKDTTKTGPENRLPCERPSFAESAFRRPFLV